MPSQLDGQPPDRLFLHWKTLNVAGRHLNMNDTVQQIIPVITSVAIPLLLSILSIVVLMKLYTWCDGVASSVMRRKRPDYKRDKTRVFTPKQKRLASQACNHRCEGTGIFFRCTYRGDDLHGDHWYPHSRGGATTEKNLVMLCPKCNNRKSDSIPSRLQTRAINRRRRSGRDYSMMYTEKVGQWLPRSYDNGSMDSTDRSWLRPGF